MRKFYLIFTMSLLFTISSVIMGCATKHDYRKDQWKEKAFNPN